MLSLIRWDTARCCQSSPSAIISTPILPTTAVKQKPMIITKVMMERRHICRVGALVVLRGGGLPVPAIVHPFPFTSRAQGRQALAPIQWYPDK